MLVAAFIFLSKSTFLSKLFGDLFPPLLELSISLVIFAGFKHHIYQEIHENLSNWQGKIIRLLLGFFKLCMSYTQVLGF